MPGRGVIRSFGFSDSPIEMPSLISNVVCQMVLEPAHGGVWIVDLDGVTTYVNVSMAKMIGCEREEMIGRSFLDFMDEEGRKISSQNLERRKQGLSAVHKFRLKHKNGSDVWALIAANPLRGQAGTIIGALAFITEIGAIDSTIKTTLIERGNLSLDRNTFEVKVNGKSVELSAFGFKLLQYFLENANRLIPRQEFLENVWNDITLSERVIDSHIVALRKKLRGFLGEIKTIYGVGYILRIHPRGKR